MQRSKFIRRTGWTLLTLFLLVNAFACFHAYKFTHFTSATVQRTNPNRLGFAGKLKVMVAGVDNPRPVNRDKPGRAYETIRLQSHEPLEAWMIRTPGAKGTVALFHGYGASKSRLLERAEILLGQGYNTLLVDFMGSGGSGGNATTIGYKEALDVKAAYDYLAAHGEHNIYLLGVSLGAAAILKALKDYPVKPEGVILEAPFSTLYEAACARFRAIGAPSFPMAGMVVFWGGVINGFWGFGHEPVEYAKSARVPVLMVYGEKDGRVARKEIDDIYNNLPGPKKRVTFPEGGHVNYLSQYGREWTSAVGEFIKAQ
ncbi:alpha/beta hydrolase [Chitinophaga barathri]|uniref:Alpha/beta hydrolase n=1 Tax=Chitinophaga barathri TaxID=1647451 RepID=A0A3N4MUM9_9BACT|nr:alpha/beta fold hydrolase [Chitinophaga barathri]RPD39163.1 alpha/beta hydrolase [Chitinophaga barathri]